MWQLSQYHSVMFSGVEPDLRHHLAVSQQIFSSTFRGCTIAMLETNFDADHYMDDFLCEMFQFDE